MKMTLDINGNILNTAFPIQYQLQGLLGSRGKGKAIIADCAVTTIPMIFIFTKIVYFNAVSIYVGLNDKKGVGKMDT